MKSLMIKTRKCLFIKIQMRNTKYKEKMELMTMSMMKKMMKITTTHQMKMIKKRNHKITKKIKKRNKSWQKKLNLNQINKLKILRKLKNQQNNQKLHPRKIKKMTKKMMIGKIMILMKKKRINELRVFLIKDVRFNFNCKFI